jgi:ubiquitin carboxyl-terminal hydrolase 34
MEFFESNDASYQDVFPRDEPFKSLYAIHALREYITAARQANSTKKDNTGSRNFTTSSYEDALKKSLSFVVQAISDKSTFEVQASTATEMQLVGSLMQVFLQLLQGAYQLHNCFSKEWTNLQ